MESWLPAIFGFSGVLIGSLFSLWLTRLQLNNADKRFEKELGKAREDAEHQRQWEVESKPLLKLRDELARMATKAARVAKPGKNLAIPLQKTKEQEEEALKEAIRDWNSYISGDDFDIVLNIQADAEIVKLVKEIRNEYLDTYDFLVTEEEDRWTAQEFGKVRRAAEEKIAPKVAQAQALINKRLKEL